MKLVIVTVVEDFHDDILKLFKMANIENFSETNIEGYKKSHAGSSSTNWFSHISGSAQSKMFFSFTDDKRIDDLFKHIKTFNETLETSNPVRAIVLPIEKFI